MSGPGPRGAEAAMAGMQLIAALLVVAAAGYGVGALVDLSVALGLVGLFAGFVIGMALVYARFRGA